MKLGLVAMCALGIVAGGTGLAYAQASPVVAGAKPVTLAGTYSFTEGPCADVDGNVFFTDQPNDRIYRVALDGTVSIYMEGTGRANGMTFDGSGNLIACADEKTELRLLSRGGASAGAEETAVAVTVLVAGYGGKRLNGPNDAFVAPSGGIYVTDPFYQRPWWSYSAMPQARQRVYYLPPGAAELVPVAEDLTQPNGIIGTPDGSTLYVADIGANRTWRYRVNADGSLVDKTLFCSLGSDGMTIDAEGNLYLTGQGVTVFDPTGKKIAWIRVPESWTSNVCFGGADRHTLFITASAHVYRLAMRVGGAFTQGK